MRPTYFVYVMIKLVLAIALTAISVTILVAQEKDSKDHRSKTREFCSSQERNWDNKVSLKDLREMTMPAAGSLAVDGGRNGGIAVKAENRSDILVRACVQAWGASEEAARSALSGVRISTGAVVKAEGPEESNFAVSYDIRVPRSIDLSLKAHNGGVSINGVEGRLEFETTNGGVSLNGIAGDVKGRTTNGGVSVVLFGNTWKGSGLDVQTSNGGVRLSIPESYSANIETGTVNGGFRSDIPTLAVTTEEFKGDTYGRRRMNRIKTSINGGGAPIRIVTTNGGINITASDRKAL